MPRLDGPACPGCGLPNYEGLCPVCRGDYPGYVEELQPYFGPWFRDAASPVPAEKETK